MGRIIKSEFYKYKINGYFIFAFLFSVALGLLGIFNGFIQASVSVNGSTTASTQSASATFMSIITGNSSYFTIFLAFVVAFIVCNDNKFNTLKNVVASGNSRNQIYFGRLISTIIAVFIFTIIHFVVSCCFAIGRFGIPANIDVVDIIVSLLIQLIAFLITGATFYGISSLFKGHIISVVANIIFNMGIPLAFYGLALLTKQSWINDISPVNLINFASKPLFPFDFDLLIALASAVIFAIIFCYAGYVIFKKKNI